MWLATWLTLYMARPTVECGWRTATWARVKAPPRMSTPQARQLQNNFRMSGLAPVPMGTIEHVDDGPGRRLKAPGVIATRPGLRQTSCRGSPNRQILQL